MRDKIRSLLTGAWSSLINGVDIDKASLALTKYMEEECDTLIFQLTRKFNDDIADLNADLDSFEQDMEDSSKLLEEVLPELEAYRCVQTHNRNKNIELSNLIFRIEEQIIKNGQ